ncbi:MAG: T9SS type A sorting domain-containing protein [Bacteroidales bacterium]
MKKICFLFFTFFGLFSLCTLSQTIAYDYDDSGNRIERIILLQNGNKGDSDNTVSSKEEVILDSAFDEGMLRIYPNPTGGLLRIEIPSGWLDGHKAMIVVYGLNGRKLIEKHVSSDIEIDLSNYQNGVYVLHIIRGDIISRWKVIKQ